MNIVKELIAMGWTPEQIAYLTKASYRQVLRWRDNETKKPLRVYREKLERLYKQEKEKEVL